MRTEELSDKIEWYNYPPSRFPSLLIPSKSLIRTINPMRALLNSAVVTPSPSLCKACEKQSGLRKVK